MNQSAELRPSLLSTKNSNNNTIMLESHGRNSSGQYRTNVVKGVQNDDYNMLSNLVSQAANFVRVQGNNTQLLQ